MLVPTRRVLSLALLTIGLALPMSAQEETPPPDLLLIFDASGSMWGQIEGENKIVIARRVLNDLVDELPEGSELGLVAYGHRREGDCADIETLLPISPLDSERVGALVDSINPKGKTPITAAAEQAFEVARGRDEPTAIVLVSDGLETCGGDPCAAVRLARQSGLDFVFHVVGFDVAGEDVSSLECMAQEGAGLFLNADDADQLAAALDQVVAAPPAALPGRLSVKGVADGELTDVAIWVTDADGEQVANGRSYTSPETNPRVLPVPEGTFEVEVTAVGLRGDATRTFSGVEIVEGQPVELVADFSTAELAIGVTRNGELSDAAVRVYKAGTEEEVDASRTYTGERSNPTVFRLTPGVYDAVVKSVEISGDAEHRFEGVELEPGGRAERAHDFASGSLAAGAVAGEELVDAVVRVVDAASGKEVGAGRTYTAARSNPKRFELPPGLYRVTVSPVRVEGRPQKTIEVTVEAGGSAEAIADFADVIQPGGSPR